MVVVVILVVIVVTIICFNSFLFSFYDIMWSTITIRLTLVSNTNNVKQIIMYIYCHFPSGQAEVQFSCRHGYLQTLFSDFVLPEPVQQKKNSARQCGVSSNSEVVYSPVLFCC